MFVDAPLNRAIRQSPGTDCGPSGWSADGTAATRLDVVVNKGTTTCANAFKVMNAYNHATNLQGSGGFGTVDGWECAHQSIGTFLQSGGAYDDCTKGGVEIVTASARHPASSAPVTPTT